MSSTCYSCPILMKLEFSRQFFKKYPHIKLHENPCSGPQLFHADGRRGRQTKLIVAFRNFAYAPEHSKPEPCTKKLDHCKKPMRILSTMSGDGRKHQHKHTLQHTTVMDSVAFRGSSSHSNSATLHLQEYVPFLSAAIMLSTLHFIATMLL